MTPGDSLIVALFNTTNTRTLTSFTITDGSNPLTVSTFDTHIASAAVGNLYIAHIDNAAFAYTSLSATWSVSGGTGGIAYVEVSDLATPSLDKTNQGNAVTTLTVATGTLAIPDEIIISASAKSNQSSYSAPSGYTITDQSPLSTAWQMALAYKIVSSTGTSNCVWALGAGNSGIAVLGTYEQAPAEVPIAAFLVPALQQQSVMRSSTW